MGPKGQKATLRVKTTVEEVDKTVRDGERITYAYKNEGGYEHMRSVLIHDVSRVPPRAEIWLPAGKTQERTSRCSRRPPP